MRRILPVVLLAAVSALPAQAAVEVGYSDPGRFTDADRAGGLMTAEGAAQALAGHLGALGRTLPAGQDLRIVILDIDLAGRLAPELDPAGSRRIMTDATWPRVRVRYELTRGGRVLARAEELVSWRDYLQRATARFAGDPLRFEKAMLAEWFEQRFGRQMGGVR
ncbi:DUF3016 domain-containing protein [Enterovirga aerilata]|uniref:DUF3016 domain-containing protein n=1 Tax=Enterovirga aerilata TaxID=2730920 RepID=A0A849I3K6_9HYPH|nr:DUF3016 domain-containing protein [Enterovirga sp. DB1703]NNM71921.1 DUF3016 domain-containing protein [Enterovirga sp. DB1703]